MLQYYSYGHSQASAVAEVNTGKIDMNMTDDTRPYERERLWSSGWRVHQCVEGLGSGPALAAFLPEHWRTLAGEDHLHFTIYGFTKHVQHYR